MINHKNYKRLRIFGMKKSLKYIIVLMLLIVMGGISYMFYSKHQQAQAKYVGNRILNGQTNADETKCDSNRNARVLFGSEFVNLETSLNYINKELSELGSEEYMDQDKLQRKQNLTDRKAYLTAIMSYYKDAAVKYQSDMKSGKGTKIEKQHAYDKAMKSAKLGSEIEDIRKKKKDITDKVNRKLAELQQTGQTTGPYMYGSKEQTELILGYQKELESLNEKQKSTMKAYRDMVDSAVGTENLVKKRN